jgi:glutamyl-tRNA(Gln) amidotransferase subunit E
MKERKIEYNLAEKIMPIVYEHPRMDFDSVLESFKFKKVPAEKILSHIPFLRNKWAETKRKDNENNESNWIMGQLRYEALGNISLNELRNQINNTKS